jgi:diguanylate cyclase (GGDEF)-like protein/PAS domain S-box-containing protein
MPELPPGEERLRALLRHVSDTVTVFDGDGTIVWLSGTGKPTLGRADEEYAGDNTFNHLHPDDRLMMAGLLAELLTKPEIEVSAEYRLRHADGSYIFCEGTAVNRLDDPLIQGIVLTSRNNSTRKRNELVLQSQAGILESIATGQPLDDTLALVVALVDDLVAGATCTIELDRPNAEAAAADDEPWARGLVGITSAVRLGVLRAGVREDRVPSPDEDAVLDAAGHLAAIALERARSEDRMARLALHDPLTALPNRTLLLDRLETAMRRMARHQQSVAVLFLDIDRFKVVNDSLGHGAGDELLVSLASRLQSAVRPGDTVARFGGDEFVVICEEIVDEVHARTVAKRLESAFDDPFHIEGGDVVITVSVGIALARSMTEDAETLLRDADSAMYQAKTEGRGRVAVFDATLRARAVERLQLEGELRQGLARGELVVHYQPVVDIRADRIVSVEALARWRHPSRDLLLPLEFLELAEETGLVVPMEQEVLLRALTDAMQWRSHDIDLAVNASAVHIADPDYVTQVREALEKTGWPPDRLILELTERVLLADDHTVLGTLGELREMGVRLVVDDFGTGYSSLGYLHRFPVDGVKIDRSFVERLGTGDRDEAVVRAILAMAEALNLEVVAEGIETGLQLQVLRRLGCRQAQGFLLGPPVGAEDIVFG